jgi:hypothetical protein
MELAVMACVELVKLWEQNGAGYKGRVAKKRRKPAAK